MKSTELNKIMKKLVLPGRFEKKGRLAYYTLPHRTGAMVLAGFYLDKSIDADSFFVNYFVQCLYAPFSTYNFSLGDRIGSYWNSDNVPELQEKINGIDVFDRLNAFDDVLFMLKNHPYYGAETGRDECFALTYYILGEYGKSLSFLEKIISLEKTDSHNWFSDKIGNARLLKGYIENGDFDKGIGQILQWQEHTIREIGLNRK